MRDGKQPKQLRNDFLQNGRLNAISIERTLSNVGSRCPISLSSTSRFYAGQTGKTKKTVTLTAAGKRMPIADASCSILSQADNHHVHRSRGKCFVAMNVNCRDSVTCTVRVASMNITFKYCPTGGWHTFSESAACANRSSLGTPGRIGLALYELHKRLIVLESKKMVAF